MNRLATSRRKRWQRRGRKASRSRRRNLQRVCRRISAERSRCEAERAKGRSGYIRSCSGAGLPQAWMFGLCAHMVRTKTGGLFRQADRIAE
jgi:hypothetical protein